MEKKAVFSTGRLVLGIIALVLCAFIIFQSCAAGAANALEANDSFSGSSGLMLAIFLLAGGIVGIATRKDDTALRDKLQEAMTAIGWNDKAKMDELMSKVITQQPAAN